MPEISIRPAVATDLKRLMAFDHSCESDYVWQLDFAHDDEQTDINFRKMRLPRTVRIYYPRQISAMADDWNRSSLMLVALIAGDPVAYIRLLDSVAPSTIWVTDLVVDRPVRRQGVASALMLAAQQWAIQRGFTRAVVEMATKNHAMLSLAQKLGFEFTGYNDQHYPARDIALFFGRALK